MRILQTYNWRNDEIASGFHTLKHRLNDQSNVPAGPPQQALSTIVENWYNGAESSVYDHGEAELKQQSKCKCAQRKLHGRPIMETMERWNKLRACILQWQHGPHKHSRWLQQRCDTLHAIADKLWTERLGRHHAIQQRKRPRAQLRNF